MKTCDVCGKSSLIPSDIGTVTLCKFCSIKIGGTGWLKKEYESNEEVEAERMKVLEKSCANSFPPNVLEAINRSFQRLIRDGLIKVCKGGLGQELEVYEEYCVINTLLSFDEEDMHACYGNICRKYSGIPNDSYKTPREPEKSTFGDFAKGLSFRGGVLGFGASLVTSSIKTAANNSKQTKKFEEERRRAIDYEREQYIGSFNNTEGKYKIQYADCDNIQFVTNEHVELANGMDYDLGYIKFQLKKYNGDPREDKIFFFHYNSSSNKIYREIYEHMSDKLFQYKKEREDAERATILEAQKQQIAVAVQETLATTQNSVGEHKTVKEELTELKELLDIGIITEEEFSIKKKQLLGI